MGGLNDDAIADPQQMTFDPEIRAVIIRALRQYRGDDYERAWHEFAGLTPMQMQMPYGRSGKTRQDILDECRTHVEQIERAMKALAPPSKP